VQSGLYFWGGKDLSRDAPKPALAAFRFPFVAYRKGSRTTLWGRTPAGKPAAVVIEAGSGAGWRRIASFRTDANGIFEGAVSTPRFSPRRPAGSEAAASPTAYRRLVVRDGATSYWHLDEAKGSVARDSAGGHPGRYQGGVRRDVVGAFS